MYALCAIFPNVAATAAAFFRNGFPYANLTCTSADDPAFLNVTMLLTATDTSQVVPGGAGAGASAITVTGAHAFYGCLVRAM